MQGTELGIWVADRDSRTLTCFEASEGNSVGRITLPEPPVALAAADGFVAAGFTSGIIAGYDPKSGSQLWRGAVGSGDLEMKSGTEHVWAAERGGGVVIAYDRSGTGSRVPTEGMQHFAPGAEGVFWLSQEKVLVHSPTQGERRTSPLPDDSIAGSMVACANAVWLSIPGGLLLLDQYSLQVRTTLKTPEGPVLHLMCCDGKLIGGSRGVFVLNPMSDSMAHALPIQPASPLRAIAAVPAKVWALESTEPLVHIADIL